MTILTHEVAKALRDRVNANDPLELIRATEQAVLERLAAGVSVEPPIPEMVARFGPPTYTLEQLNTAIAAARVQALEEAATLIESTELSGLNNDIQLQVFVGKLLIEYCKAIRALIGKEST